MDRCKLEYMIKKADFKIKKAIIQEMDPYGDYKFKKDVSKFLQNPETEDFEILQNLPEILYIPGEKEKLLNLEKIIMELDLIFKIAAVGMIVVLFLFIVSHYLLKAAVLQEESEGTI